MLFDPSPCRAPPLPIWSVWSLVGRTACERAGSAGQPYSVMPFVSFLGCALVFSVLRSRRLDSAMTALPFAARYAVLVLRFAVLCSGQLDSPRTRFVLAVGVRMTDPQEGGHLLPIWKE
jgi:hypothetical protein